MTSVTVTEYKEFNLIFHFFYLLSVTKVRELGKFHGECYALKESNRGLFHIITKSFRESRYAVDFDEIYGAMLKASPKRGTQAIRENHELRRMIPEEFLQKIEELSEEPWKYFKKCVVPVEPLATIIHGDYLRNNIAFQYDEKVKVFFCCNYLLCCSGGDTWEIYQKIYIVFKRIKIFQMH